MAIEFWKPRTSVLRRPQNREMSRREPDFGDMIDHFFRGWPSWTGGESLGWAPAIDVMDRPNEILVRADLPGVTEKDVKVTVDNGTLTIHGERKEEKEEKDENYFFSERSSGSFTRSLVIPTSVNTEQIEANFKNGVLEVRLPKMQESSGKRIEVKAA